MNVSVIIPAKNEESTIERMVVMLLSVYPYIINQVIVVDDGSTDRTRTILKKLAQKDRRITVMSRKPPFGVGLAIREGLTRVSARSTHILSMDADFIRNISDLNEFFTEIRKWDGIIGSRYGQRNLLIQYPFLKRIANRAFHLIVRLLFGITHTDLTNNFKLYKKVLFQNLPLKASDYAINAETGLYPIRMGYTIGELSVPWFARERHMGVSKFRLARLLPSYLAVLARAWAIRANRKPGQKDTKSL